MVFEVDFLWLDSIVAIDLNASPVLAKLLSCDLRVFSDRTAIWVSVDMRDDFLFLTLSSKDSSLAFAWFDEECAFFEILSGVMLDSVLSRNRLSFLATFGEGGNPGKPNFASWSVGVFSHLLGFGEITHARVDGISCVS